MSTLLLNSSDLLLSLFGLRLVRLSLSDAYSPNLELIHVLGNAAIDIESFAKHAGRSTIKTDDILLLTRRNEGLEQILKDAVEQLKNANDNKKQAKGTD